MAELASKCSQRETIFLDAFDSMKFCDKSFGVSGAWISKAGPREDLAEAFPTAPLAPHSSFVQSLQPYSLVAVAALQLCFVLRFWALLGPISSLLRVRFS